MRGNRIRKLKTRIEQLSQEKGTIHKDWGGRLPVALIYPNAYFLGMSNLGIHVIYRLLNSHRRVVCERAFWEKENREKSLPPRSLESQRPLSDFAVLAFSISYELDYFNVVQILRSSGIPLYAAERDERHPLIIAGGPCITANPMPLAPFFDCLCLGEAEAIIPGMLPILLEDSGNRNELLKTLASLPGVYVPAHYSGKPIARQWARNLDDLPASSVILTPDTELGNLYLIEVERGCNRGCRFCMVHTTFSPMRFRSAEIIVEQAKEGLKHKQRIGLVGPAVSDHPRIEEIIDRLLGIGAELSISSLRIGPRSSQILTKMAQGKAKTVAIAPEAGSERLRQMIKKGISEDDILEFVSKAAAAEIKQLKLYFIIGLPSETEEDIREIIRLAQAAKDIADRQHGGMRINLNIAPFVPKAGTPFQWLPMAPVPVLTDRLSLLKNNLSPRGIKIKSESPAWSQVQTALARGDTRLAEVLAGMEELSLSGWRKAVAKCHLDIDYYVNQVWDIRQKLPWSAIDSGAEVSHLEQELHKALV